MPEFDLMSGSKWMSLQGFILFGCLICKEENTSHGVSWKTVWIREREREREILKTEATGCVRNERRVLAFLLEALISKLSSYSGLFFPTAPLMHLH